MAQPVVESIKAPQITPGIRVLLAEDEQNLGTILEQFLSARGFIVTMVRDGRAALDKLRAEAFDVALLDIMMPEMDGLEVLRRVREHPFPPEVIVITGNGSVDTAISAIKMGAYDFLAKPYRMAEIEALVRRAWEKRVLTRDNAHLHSRLQRKAGQPTFITQYAPMLAVLGVIQRVSPSESPVLITGESGTGKHLVARLLHAHSERTAGPFVELDCAVLTDDSLESELFGVENGAPGDANRPTLGLLELATSGTLYLNGIADLDLKAQAKLMRALDGESFRRIGGARSMESNMRIVASTSKDLLRLATSGFFRDDLLRRIDTIRVALPPLRDRKADVAPLAEYFLQEFGGSAPPRLSDDALVTLERYRWPGNVRELRNVIERAVLLASDGVIWARDLPLTAESGAAVRRAGPTPLTLIDLERQHIQNVLDSTGWHQGRASELLGISPKTLYRKIREYGFRRPSRTGGVMGSN